MFRNLNLSAKILLVLTPFFLLAVAAIIILNYAYQESSALTQAKSAATRQALTIREALVDQMMTNYSVDREFLQRVSTAADMEDLDVWFFADSLRLMEEYQTPLRMKRLRESEMRLIAMDVPYARAVFRTGEALWILTCKRQQHENEVLTETSEQPRFLRTCDELRAIIPFVAERKCQECHTVPVGTVLGAAHMKVPLLRTTAALRDATMQSIYIVLAFAAVTLLIGLGVYRRFVARPLRNLITATETLGQGKLDEEIIHQFDHDEFGKLAASFDDMQARLKEIQKELVHRERLSTVGQMAGSIIHDFRSPMTSIMLAIDRLQDPTTMGEQERNELFTLVRNSIERMNRMMVELLDFARGDVVLNHAECDVREFTDAITRMVRLDAERKNITFTSQTDFTGVVVIDRDRLQRALLNILANAEDATPPGGRIRMKTASMDGLLVFQIQDTGPGIPLEVRSRIFEPFVTFGKKRGTGLGLAIAKRIIEEHHGSIGFQTHEGVGTTFFVKIPLKPPYEKKEAA